MNRGSYSLGKRQRDAVKARKKQRKADRQWRKRQQGPGEVPITSVEAVTGDLKAEEARRARPADAPQGARAIPSRLFVGNLSWDTTEDSLRKAFEEFGAVSHVVIVNDRATGKSRGFGFVTMEDRKDAARAIEALNDADLDGRNIVVNQATERPR